MQKITSSILSSNPIVNEKNGAAAENSIFKINFSMVFNVYDRGTHENIAVYVCGDRRKPQLIIAKTFCHKTLIRDQTTLLTTIA